jgi:transcription-repair coupling factor (superfamily II helicase)
VQPQLKRRLFDSMEILLQKIRELPQFGILLQDLKSPSPPARSEFPRLALGLPRAARLATVAAIHHDLPVPILLVTDRADHALTLFDELGFWLQSPRYLLAEPNPLFYEPAAWGPNTRRDRLQALTALVSDDQSSDGSPVDAPVVIASARAFMTRTLPPGEFRNACRQLTVGMPLQPDVLQRHLFELGYRRENTVLETGTYSSRGGLLDLWPPADAQPIRLDFFGTVVETIRRFDPGSQRTIAQLMSVRITPAREFIIGRTDVHIGTQLHAPATSPTPVAREISEFDIPTLHAEPATVLDYLPRGGLVLIDDLSVLDSMMEEIEEQAVKFRQASVTEGSLTREFPAPYVSWSELRDGLHEIGAVELGHSTNVSEEAGGLRQDTFAPAFRHDRRFGGQLKPFTEYLAALLEQGQTVVTVSRQSPRLQELWAEAHGTARSFLGPAVESSNNDDASLTFVEASLSEGFVIGRTHLITDSEIFGWDRPQPRSRQRLAAETPEAFYADLRPGDHVVHIDHGIGRYQGLVLRQMDGLDREFLALEYGSGGQVFVPVHQADRLTRYVGAEGAEPALDRLGGQEWQEKKGRVKAAVLEVAQEMLDLHARRHVIRGHAFKVDTSWQKELEDSFPYVETPDQGRALLEIKRDMESARPMDRLLCGDVGYGKTELALRAAFKAVMDGRQAAILVPTTVLAQQHYETFLQRLAAFPVQVEMLSRFRSPREQSSILLGLASGEIDIVIGTHRLISQDVQFKDLGLVIIDEEQRFGVTHKEHLKRLRSEVDVLTLTATPIPRTLYMALTGVRDISNLNTPPEERLPIVTHIGPYSPQLARQAIMRELERGGQIFFVHNRVDTIQGMRMHLSQLVPEARIDVGHGQMPEHELADVMHRFNGGHTDVLLSTTIIESGLDIPNANTLIVDRADTFGLAQLYQLRGRVGRGASRAYAYFFRHRKLSASVEAQQRLEVIAENTELGSGYSIAMRDLEIRGAGDLLGTRQHGHIQAVGFHLYTRLLADAVRQIRHGRLDIGLNGLASAGESATVKQTLPGLNWPVAMPVTVEIPLAAGIPAAYIPDGDLRLRLYRRIADIRDEAELDALESEFADRFGPAPERVHSLLLQMRLKLRAEKAGVSSIGWESGQFVLRLRAADNGKAAARLPDLAPGIRGGKGAYWCTFGHGEDWKVRLLEILDLVHSAHLPVR